MEVHKFGGSSFRDKASVLRTANLIKDLAVDNQIVVVVSAAFGVTSFLIDSLSSPDSVVEGIRKRHLELCSSEEFEVILDDKLSDLQELISAYSHGAEELRDYILSYGERLMVSLLSYLIGAESIMAERFIRTDGVFGDARINHELTREVASSLTWGSVTVVPGYYGVSNAGAVTLLGRSGTDYSATAVALALGLHEVHIWKDVSGFMTADPRLVPDARTIEELHYDEAEMLSYFGAKILHPLTISAARHGNLTVRLRDLESDKGTIISPDSRGRTTCLSYLQEGESIRSSFVEADENALIYISTTSSSLIPKIFNITHPVSLIHHASGLYLSVPNESLQKVLVDLHSFFY